MITAEHIINMINHWLSTPPNGYFAQSYGADVKAMLLKNPSSENADKFLDKLRADIPLLADFDSSQLSIESKMIDFEKEKIYLFVGNMPIFLGDTQDKLNNQIGQDYYDSRAS